MVNTPKHYLPNSKALPPLLDAEAEKLRLASIAEEQEKENINNKKTKNLQSYIKSIK